MDCQSTSIAFSSTGAFTRIAMDYVAQAASLRPFYKHETGRDGIRQSIEERRKAPDHRAVLSGVLREQYEGVETSEKTSSNLAALAKPNSFTVTTAHQNNLFTGPLYFIYKILHVVKLAEELSALYPADHFIPVYYMGSEDADLQELNHVTVYGNKHSWNPIQDGAVGRMKVDYKLLQLVDTLTGQLSVTEEGQEIMAAVRKFYREGETIQRATFLFVNYLLGEFGVVVLIPDHAKLKSLVFPIFEDELLNQTASGIVQKSAAELGRYYKVQAHPREINLFYLDEQVRERIEREGETWKVRQTGQEFSREGILLELREHPERFSPNVILRGLYQETILPNILFVGGGGELAYWLELRQLFEHYRVPMPVLMLRNSFLVTGKRQAAALQKLGFTVADIFIPADELLNRLVKRETDKNLSIHSFIDSTNELYGSLLTQATQVDPTLSRHVDALRAKSLYRLVELQKKILRAEKRNFADRGRQINALKKELFPNGSLQERVDNILPLYARQGRKLLHELHRHSPGIDAAFIILECGD
ncbi:MAG: bacillithiol biosynthesis cysteine-adding enzyme BshC [Chitinophagaceae bacterium]|nr:MAG: bacillithiol biosynthesis cysteine-adding enzyme BshC [Chitinophagaceae bacterium]